MRRCRGGERIRGLAEPADEFTVGAGFDGEDPQETRDRLFSAVRSVAEAMSRRRPLVLAFEDIHWADEGMLDLIEYLARWVRGPVLLICLARDELLDRLPVGQANVGIGPFPHA